MSDENLRLHIEAIEAMIADKKDIAADISDRYKLAKMDGYDVKALKAIIARRAIERAKLEELDALVETYESALSEAD